MKQKDLDTLFSYSVSRQNRSHLFLVFPMIRGNTYLQTRIPKISAKYVESARLIMLSKGRYSNPNSVKLSHLQAFPFPTVSCVKMCRTFAYLQRKKQTRNTTYYLNPKCHLSKPRFRNIKIVIINYHRGCFASKR